MVQQKKMRWRAPLKVVVFGFIAVAFIWIFLNVVLDEFRPAAPVALGATFSTKYSHELGLNPREVFIAALDELRVKRFRTPVYWDEVEPKRGTFQFEELDWMIAAARERGAEIIPAIGLRVPRWPECHAPAWAADLSETERNERVLNLIRTIVTRYRDESAIIAWQIENEPLLGAFGECPEPDRAFLKQEATLVRELDNRPIIITESGELSSWLRTVGISDILGISMYRSAWNRYVGYFYYPLSPGFYRYRAAAVRPFTSDVVVTELQAEPWLHRGVIATPLREQYRAMDTHRLAANISFISRAGFREAYLWGIEWWYWLHKTQGNASLWESGKEIFAASAPHSALRLKEK